MTDSILQSIKQLLGVNPEYGYFDNELIGHINSVFMTLQQLGVGPEEGFAITGVTETWHDFLGEDELIFGGIRSYMAQKVRLMWDTTALTGSVIDSIQKNIAEFEWRLNNAAEMKKRGDSD